MKRQLELHCFADIVRLYGKNFFGGYGAAMLLSGEALTNLKIKDIPVINSSQLL